MIPAARYSDPTHSRWIRRFGRLIDPDGPAGEHRLVGRRTHTTWPVGIYIAVDEDDRVRYVGKVCRSDGQGFDARFANHDQPVEDWPRVWLVPLRPNVADLIVRAVEALFIQILRPTDNIVRPTPTILPLHLRYRKVAGRHEAA